MNMVSFSDLPASAFRIWLMYVTFQTKEALEKYKLKKRFATSPTQQIQWQRVVDAAQRVITYAENCQNDENGHGSLARCLHGLSAVGAAQEALSSFLSNAQLCLLGSEKNWLHFEFLSEAHTLRAKCIVNSIISVDRHDLELSVLWDEASTHLLKKCQLRRRDNQECLFSEEDIAAIQQLSFAPMVKQLAAKYDCVEARELSKKAARNCRLAVVHRVLGRQTDYYFAAETYFKAAEACSQSHHKDLIASQLWLLTVSTLRLAAEMIETQAQNFTARNDSLVSDTLRKAAVLEKKALDVSNMEKELEDMTRKNACTFTVLSRFTMPCVLPVCEKFTNEQDQMHALWMNYVAAVTEDARSDIDELLRQFCTAKECLVSTAAAIEELVASIHTAEYYRSQISECTHIDHNHLRALYRQCWTRAADLATGDVHLSAKLITEGESHPLESHPLAATNRALRTLNRWKAKMYITHALNTVHVAVEYFNKARGAQTTNCKARDPREAQWWRAAADCQRQAAAKCISSIRRIAGGNLSDANVLSYLSQTCKELMDEANIYAMAADYLQRAYHIKMQPEQLVHTMRVSELYTQAAEYVYVRSICGPLLAMSYSQAEKLCLELVDILLGIKKSVCEEHTAMLECACQYAYKMSSMSLVCKTESDIWQKAFSACVTASQLSVNGWNTHASMAVVSGVLHARAAALHNWPGDKDTRRASVAYSLAAEMMCDVCIYQQEDAAVTEYRIALAYRIAELCSEGVPEELALLYETVNVHPAAVEIFEEHVVSCSIELECTHEATSAGNLARESAFTEAKNAANLLNSIYMAQIQALCKPRKGKHKSSVSPGYCALLKVSLQCYLAAARSMSPVWSSAVELCRQAKNTWYRNDALAAIMWHVRLAEAIQADDDELADLCIEAAFVAEQIFYMLTTATMVQRRTYDYMLKVANHRVHELLAQRMGQHELAAAHARIANSTAQLNESLYGENDRKICWTSLIVQTGRLEAKVIARTEPKTTYV